MKKGCFWLFFLLLSALARDARAFAANCSGADLSQLTSAIYVSPQGTDSTNCGQNLTSPCKTIERGITNCQTLGEGCGVLVRYGIYNVPAPLKLADGVSLYGSCTFDETEYKYRSMIVGRPYAILANKINSPTTVYGFVILGTAGSAAGQATFAIVIQDSTGLTLSHDVLSSGKGVDGAAGVNAPTGGPGARGQASNGNTGGAGGKACEANPPTGSRGQGGKGADYQQVYSSGCNLGGCECTNNNYSVAENGNPSGAVFGGIGGTKGTFGASCEWEDRSAGVGGDGKPGSAGGCSAQGGVRNADTRGTFSGITWQASYGGVGVDGEVGSGGGGGGSGGFGVVPPPLFGSAKDLPGSPGGAGGGGGCGGPRGHGGQQGGASVPLVLANSSNIQIDSTTALIPGPGGGGGRGGNAAKGGVGGVGSAGGMFEQRKVDGGTVPGVGGRGGNGGQGGAGSGGAGGNGGPSFAIALVNSPSFPLTGVAVYPAQPGAGGDPGTGDQNESSQCKAADGQSGLPGFSGDLRSEVSFRTKRVSGSNQ